MTLAAVFLVSCATLAFEVALARIFAVSQWNHLSFLVISMALFGFAASGTVLSLLGPVRSGRPDPFPPFWIPGAVVIFSGSLLTALIALNRIPLDYHRLPFQPVQAAYLLLVCLAIALPFFVSGGLVATAFVLRPEKPGAVYFTSMAGSALGALAPALLLPLWGEARLVIASALSPLILIAFMSRGRPPADRRRPAAAAATAAAGLLVLAAGIWLLTPGAEEVRAVIPSEYKMISQVLRFPETRVVEQRATIRGRIERVKSPHLRFAPGLSLKFPGVLPTAQAVFTDGDRPLYLYDTAAAGWPEFARFSLSFLPYALAAAPQKVLTAAAGGGLSIACAAASGAAEVRILTPTPEVAGMIARHYGQDVIAGDLRAYLAGTDDRFDIIHLENWGASIPGAGALDQDHTLTVAAFKTYLDRLTPEGLLVVSRRLLLPPADSLRLWAAARKALAAAGIAAPELCLAIVRNWDTYTMVMARRPFADPAAIAKWAGGLNFDIVYLAGAHHELANRFNVFDAPYHFIEHQRLAGAAGTEGPAGFHNQYVIDVAPQPDLRPFPDRFLKWSRAGELHRTLGGRSHIFLFSGETIVAVAFAEALLVSLVLLLVPAALLRGRARAPRPAGIIFFLAIGAGFMFAELLWVYAGTFLLGDPVVSLTLVVAGVLIASGLGGLISQRFSPAALKRSAAAAAFGIAVAAAALGAFAESLLALPWAWRAFLLLAAAMLPAVVMGMLFPLGMRWAVPHPAAKAYAWAVNGCASVLAAIASAQLAISIGFHAIAAAAVISYLAAALAGSHADRG
ncbi:MAG: hypothetical protein MUC46_03435 [Desulfobacterales bacterium]|nr:hypothetical protein [Desulfobacterales bacterium]